MNFPECIGCKDPRLPRNPATGAGAATAALRVGIHRLPASLSRYGRVTLHGPMSWAGRDAVLCACRFRCAFEVGGDERQARTQDLT